MRQLIDLTSFVIALISFTISMIFFYGKTKMFVDSLLVAIISAGFFWIGYISLRLCYLVAKRDK